MNKDKVLGLLDLVKKHIWRCKETDDKNWLTRAYNVLNDIEKEIKGENDEFEDIRPVDWYTKL